MFGLDPAGVYNSTARSIVTVQGFQLANTFFGTAISTVLGSGFVASYNGSDYIVTNYHVVSGVSNITVTFLDGNAYTARVVGYDPYSDLAVVQTSGAPASEFQPLTFSSSSLLRVGEPVIAIGNPFGLSGSVTFGVVSQLGRTIQDSTAGNYSIANAIQFSAPINPGNSGGPLLDGSGTVVGMTTAVVSGSQGVGFAIPSDTITRELSSIVRTGGYSSHSYLGIGGADMNYQLAQAMKTSVTFGVLVEGVTIGSPASTAGIRAGSQNVQIAGQRYLIGGDIIISANGTRILNNDGLATYLQQGTLPGQTVNFGIIRSGAPMTVAVVIGQRA